MIKAGLILLSFTLITTLAVLFILFCIGEAQKKSYPWRISIIERAIKMLPVTEANLWVINNSFHELRRIDRDPDRTKRACAEFFKKYRPFWNKIVE